MWDCYRGKFDELKQQIPPEWELESLKQIFSLVKASNHPRLTIYMLIDAMDESDEQRREEILELFSGVCDFKGGLILKVLVASRPVPRIASAFKGHITITLEEETKKDIICFSSKRIEKICKILGINTDTTALREIHHTIVERSQGVFLWVVPVLKHLEDIAHDGCNLFEMKKVLEYLPQDLDDFYAFMLRKLEKKWESSLGAVNCTEALRMLQWVAYSNRPLGLLELMEAVAVTLSDSISLSILENRRPLNLEQAKRILLTKCGGFLEVNDGIVQFIHQTVREFLLSRPATSQLYISEHESTRNITTTCLRYLGFIDNEMKVITGKLEYDVGEIENINFYNIIVEFLKSSQLTLLNYAAYAPQPANLSDPLQRDYTLLRDLESLRQQSITFFRGLFERATYFDRTNCIELLLQSGAEIHQGDIRDVIEAFLKNKSKDHPCFLACEGYSCTVNWLVCACGWSIGELLQHGSSKGHSAGVQSLLKQDVSDTDIFEAFRTAITENHWDIADLVLSHGFKDNDMYKASYNALQTFAGSDKTRVGPLHLVASKGFKAMIPFCIDNGEDINCKDAKGQTPLHVAVAAGHENTVVQLLDCGANKEARTNEGLTALHLACMNGHYSIVQTLAQSFHVNTKAQDNNGSTGLHLACANGRDSITQLLIHSFGIDKRTVNKRKQTALHLLLKYIMFELPY